METNRFDPGSDALAQAPQVQEGNKRDWSGGAEENAEGDGSEQEADEAVDEGGVRPQRWTEEESAEDLSTSAVISSRADRSCATSVWEVAERVMVESIGLLTNSSTTDTVDQSNKVTAARSRKGSVNASSVRTSDTMSESRWVIHRATTSYS